MGRRTRAGVRRSGEKRISTAGRRTMMVESGNKGGREQKIKTKDVGRDEQLYLTVEY